MRQIRPNIKECRNPNGTPPLRLEGARGRWPIMLGALINYEVTWTNHAKLVLSFLYSLFSSFSILSLISVKATIPHLIQMDEMDDCLFSKTHYFCKGRKKSLILLCLCKIFPIFAMPHRMRQDMIRKRLAIPHLWISTTHSCVWNTETLSLGMIYMTHHIYSLRCERLLLFSTQAVESPQVE